MSSRADTLTERADAAAGEVVGLCRDLIRFDTSNYGDQPGPGERAAAEWVAGQLSDAGIEPTVLESEPGRTSVVARLAGSDPARDALLVHGHLDVVPADAADWQVDPFAGEVRDGMLWGRGAIDMKDMVAMTLAAARAYARTRTAPPRDLVLAFVADEEAGGVQGAHFLVERHRELFDGCTEAVSEVGGFSVTAPDDSRLYLIETAEKGIAWLKLTMRGTAGHGSMTNPDNAVTALAEAVGRLGRTRLPQRLTPTVQAFLERMTEPFGLTLDPDDIAAGLGPLGPIGRIISATLRNTATPTMLAAGYKVNVIPGTATAYVDGRFLPGHEATFLRELDEILGPDVVREDVHRDIAVETSFDGALVDAMGDALRAEDPGAQTVPYCLSGGTDAKSFSTLGMRCFGFSPLLLPPDLDFSGLFHGVDERVPLAGLEFGARVLTRFLDAS